MSSVINSDLSLTDKTKPFSTVLDKLSSGTSKMRTDKNKTIKFHGTEVKNVIIHYTTSKGKPENVLKKEFDASKIKLEFDTLNVQVVADYITITFYKDEHSNLILQSRLVLCGMISEYNATSPMPGPSNMFLAITKRLRLQGFIVTDHYDMTNQFLNDMTRWVKEGKIKWKETLFEGLENVPKAFIAL